MIEDRKQTNVKLIFNIVYKKSKCIRFCIISQKDVLGTIEDIIEKINDGILGGFGNFIGNIVNYKTVLSALLFYMLFIFAVASFRKTVNLKSKFLIDTLTKNGKVGAKHK